ncbi:MAG TPA: LysM peptidoglycan-binding domain-containing protein [Sedimentibacter sp.]|nr:LysM peptidoglycan-binding domain-containing protein [Sedimentibacter sp.]HOH68922.1 LysM peptidoglycan-binding domain-containing protein [Sedimentibacter sp.]HQB63691.1 LysM peptidoglycan-binding domain-containing protein [Sedimentibacter sp.]
MIYRQNQQLCPNINSMPYEVRPGDTLNSIATRFGTNLVGLIELNPTLRLRSLTEGMMICVPKVPERPPCINGAYYAIREGDTFYNLAQRYGIPLNLLLEANPEANPYDLKVGQEICIPNVPAGCPFGTVVTIQEGTRLSDILISYNLSLNELRDTNPNFNPNIIVPGEQLCIPPEAFMQCPQGTRGEYVIKAGDSLSTVAEANGLTTSGLLIANPHLRPANFLIIGTRVCIP